MKIEKVEKVVANLHDKTEYVIHINLKQALNHRLVLKKVHRVIKFNQNAKTIFFLRIMQFFGKTMENIRKLRDIKLVTTERRNYLVSEPNCHTTKFFTENLLAIEMKNAEILMNKSVYLRLSILELSEILIYEFWYDYVKRVCWKSEIVLYGYR